MSRIGKKPLPLPKGVTVGVGRTEAEVKGPKGVLTVPVPYGISVRIEENVAHVERKDDSKPQRALHGLTRALLANAVHGVSEGYERALQVVGTGYKVEPAPKGLTLALGFSHPVVFELPQGVAARVEDKNTTIVLAGIDKQQLGQVAANLRAIRPPDAYKGKGIRYKDEQIVLKPGKAAGK
ncbi:MAG: 50S ribosomal protein L6 [Candidatus Polarisedimenticolia bacterium]|nr:50S ribosomal protein L6 [bacterium]